MKLSSSDAMYEQMHQNQKDLVSNLGLRGKMMLRKQYYTLMAISLWGSQSICLFVEHFKNWI